MFVPLTPLRCLHRAVDLYGSRIGVVSGGRQFTYIEFSARCERLATGLTKFGIAAGDRVADYHTIRSRSQMRGAVAVFHFNTE